MTIDPPPCAIICGSTAFADFHTPVRFTAIMSSHISSVSPCAGASEKMPAFAMRMSMRPNAASPSATA